MAKLNPIFGKATGKVGGSVFQINSGVQIWKEKAVKVNNPNTDAQVEQRAKLKLMSQIAAALGPYIAIPKKGLVSARNQFISKNFSLVTFENNRASVDVDLLQLTAGNTYLPMLNKSEGTGGRTRIELMQPADSDIQSVQYILAEVNEATQLSVIGAQLVSTPGTQRHFEYEVQLPAGDYVCFAFGVKSGNDGNSINYDDYIIITEGGAAVLDVTKLAKVAASVLTKTSGLYTAVS